MERLNVFLKVYSLVFLDFLSLLQTLQQILTYIHTLLNLMLVFYKHSLQYFYLQ